MSIYMVCESCTFRFVSRSFHFQNTRVRIFDVTENCPVCNGAAHAIDGEYDFVGEALAAFRPLNRQKRTRLQRVLERARQPEADQSELEKAVSEISPEIGALIKRAKKGQYSYLVVMIFLLLLLQRCSGGSIITINRPEINIIWQEAVSQAETIEAGLSDANDTSEHDDPSFHSDTGGGVAPEPPSIKPDVSNRDAKSLNETDKPTEGAE